jgi:hypothetical protein
VNLLDPFDCQTGRIPFRDVDYEIPRVRFVPAPMTQILPTWQQFAR